MRSASEYHLARVQHGYGVVLWCPRTMATRLSECLMQMYIRSFWFVVDAVACLPLFVIPVMWNSAQTVRLVFLVKVGTLYCAHLVCIRRLTSRRANAQCFWFFRMEDAFPWLAHLNLLYAALWRIGRLGIMLVLLSHWTGMCALPSASCSRVFSVHACHTCGGVAVTAGCLWFGVSDSQTVAGYDLPWTHVTPGTCARCLAICAPAHSPAVCRFTVFDGGPPISESSTLDQYVVSLNVGLFLLMGESINFQTRAEYLLAFCCLVVGAFMYVAASLRVRCAKLHQDDTWTCAWCSSQVR